VELEISPNLPELLDETVEGAIALFDGGKILVDNAFGGARVASPQEALHVPVEQLVALQVVVWFAAVHVEVATHHRESIAAPEYPIMVEPKTRGDQVKQGVDGLLRVFQAGAEFIGIDVLECGKQGFPCDDGVHVTQEPVHLEVEASTSPLSQALSEFLPRFGPRRADLGQGQIPLRELRATAVHPIENVYHHVDGLVFAGDFFGVKVNFLYAVYGGNAIDLRLKPALQLRVLDDLSDGFARPELHQLRYIDPEGVVLHLRRHIELERLFFEMEVQARERGRVAIEEGRRSAPYYAVECGHALLPVEE
jgi:hypothetical protein